MEILYWPIEPTLKKDIENHYRTKFAINLKDKEPLEVIRQITFDGVAPAIEIKDIENLFDFVERKFLKRKINGVGVEVGSGPGTFSSVLAERNSVEKIYAVEVCEPIVKLLAPKVADYVLDGSSNKVIGVVGSFDSMELPDESVDFIFDFFSLHHSNNLAVTFRECSRILKKDGFIFCFDKGRPDYFTPEDLNELLDAEYDYDFKKQMGMPLDSRFTRRMNDEKEYRLKDWISAFNGAGFSKIKYFYLAKTISNNFGFRAIKSFLSNFPVSLQLVFNKLLPLPKFNHKFILAAQNRIFTKPVNPFPKEISLMIAYK